MALIPEMSSLGSEINLTISMGEKNNEHPSPQLFAEHLWISESQHQKIHGYKFLHLDTSRKEYVLSLLSRENLDKTPANSGVFSLLKLL